MAISPANMNGTAAHKPVAFSYAQAAKGKPSPSSTPSALPDTTPKEPTSWADDSGDSSTMVDEPHANGAPNGTGPSPELPVKASLAQTPAETVPELPVFKPSSPNNDLSASVKDDVSQSPTKTAQGSTWDVKPQSWSLSDPKAEFEEGGQTLVEDGTDGNKAGSDRKSSTSEEPKSYKEAPAPTVNFWQQRALEAKAKQPSPKPASGGFTAQQPVALPVDVRSTAEKPANGSQRRFSTLDVSARDVALPKATKARSLTPNRKSNSEAPALQSAAPPPAGDATAWPTPMTAKDEDRRKAQEKGDKDRPAQAAAKPHSKNEWVPVPFTPSVKFNTPLPASRGRGGRPGARGGRGGSVSERGNNASAKDAIAEKSDQEGRNGFGNSNKPGSSSNKPVNPNGEADSRSREASQSAQSSQQKRSSVQEDSTAVTASLQSAQKNRRLSRSQQDKSAAPQTEDSRSVQQGEEGNLKSTAQGAESRRRSVASLADTPADGISYPRSRKVNGFAGNSIDYTQGRSNGQDVANGLERRTSAETRPGAPNMQFEPYQQGASQPSSRGRGERGRGRGGRAGFHGTPHNYTGVNGQLPPLQTTTLHGKGSTYQPSYSGSASPMNYERRGGGSRSGPRSASIPTEQAYNRYGAAYPVSPQYPNYGPAMNGVYEYGMAPMNGMGAVPYAPYVDSYVVFGAVAQQLNYYFSLENMLKDMYLRKHMDSQGFVSISLLANFKRMKELTNDFELIKFTCAQSPEFELRTSSDGQLRIRKREGWEKWVLDMNERDPSARNDGPPPQQEPAIPIFQPQSVNMQAPMSPLFNGMQRGMENGVGRMPPSFSPALAASPYLSPRSPPDQSNRHSLSVLDGPVSGHHSRQLSSASAQGSEVDAFPDQDVLTLVVGVRRDANTNQNPRPVSISSRTFSNGSIEAGDLQDMRESRALSPQERLPTDSDFRQQNSSRSVSSARPDVGRLNLFWLKGSEGVATSLPSNGEELPYYTLHERAHQARSEADIGTLPYHMDVLYQFWSHFLIRNFNARMYNEFCSVALQDAAEGRTDAGMKHLVTYYSEALNSQQTIRERVARDYVDMVKREDPSKPRPAFEQLRLAWRNGALNIKNRKKISDVIDQDLRQELDR